MPVRLRTGAWPGKRHRHVPAAAGSALSESSSKRLRPRHPSHGSAAAARAENKQGVSHQHRDPGLNLRTVTPGGLGA